MPTSSTIAEQHNQVMIQLHTASLNRKRIKVANLENHVLVNETVEKNRILTASKSGNDQKQ